jgi:hypothetical protein
MDLKNTYTHDSELQEIRAPPIISTIHKSPQHQLSLFSACCLISRYLATASNSRDSSASRAKVLSSQPPLQNSTQLIGPTVLVRTSRHGPHRNHSSTVAYMSVAAEERVYRAVSPTRPRLGPHRKRTVSNSNYLYIVACVFVAAGTCLPSR